MADILIKWCFFAFNIISIHCSNLVECKVTLVSSELQLVHSYKCSNSNTVYAEQIICA